MERTQTNETESVEKRYCEYAWDLARAATSAPEWERGGPLAVLSNHLRECEVCRG